MKSHQKHVLEPGLVLISRSQGWSYYNGHLYRSINFETYKDKAFEQL